MELNIQPGDRWYLEAVTNGWVVTDPGNTRTFTASLAEVFAAIQAYHAPVPVVVPAAVPAE